MRNDDEVDFTSREVMGARRTISRTGRVKARPMKAATRFEVDWADRIHIVDRRALVTLSASISWRSVNTLSRRPTLRVS